jgi:hypothetical protein
MSELEDSWTKYLEDKGILKKKEPEPSDLDKSFYAYLERKGIMPVICDG